MKKLIFSSQYFMKQETSEKTDKLTHVWVICSDIFANKSDVKEEIKTW